MKKQKRLLISILTILLILTALLFLSEIPYSFRFFRKSLLKDFVSDPGDSLLYAYNVKVTNPHFKWGFGMSPIRAVTCTPEGRVSQALLPATALKRLHPLLSTLRTVPECISLSLLQSHFQSSQHNIPAPKTPCSTCSTTPDACRISSGHSSPSDTP